MKELDFSHYFHSLSLLFLFYFNFVDAQPASDEAGPQYLKLGPELSRPIAVAIVVVVFVFFIMVFLSVYLRHYLELDAVLRAADVDRFGIGFGMCDGLDPSVIRTFPVVAHSALKEMKIAKWSFEYCAVCLSEFHDYETLRLLPQCGHVFHSNCIDAWLASCATCPICRAKLAAGGDNSALELVTISVVDEADRNGLGDSEPSNEEVCEMESGGPLGGASVEGGEKSVEAAGGGEVAGNHDVVLGILEAN